MINYKTAGVDVEKADRFVNTIKSMVGDTYNENVKSGIGGYASLYQIDPDRYIASSTDGVGTKLKLAIELDKHDTIGIDLVAMCANDLICTGARPLFFLDYLAMGTLDISVSESILSGITKGCIETRMALVGGETAEMPGMYAKDHYDLAGFCVGDVREKELVKNEDMKPGDIIIGLESSGMHSNGFSLIRKVCSHESDSMKRELLTPTKLYVNSILETLKSYKNEVHAIAHITGGGLKNYLRLNDAVGYDLSLMPHIREINPVFGNVIENARLDKYDSYNTFNMGIGMSLVVDKNKADEIMNTLRALNENPMVIGQITRDKGTLIYPDF